MRIPLSVILTLIINLSLSQVNSNFSLSSPNGCSPLAVNFIDLSSGSPTSWVWSFGNGNSSSLQNPSAVYITPGLYVVSLEVSDGITTSISYDTVTIYTNPVVNFMADNTIGCSDLNVNFTNLSTTGTGIAAALWNFGDGNTSNLINPSHVFGPGEFDVTLIVTDSSGCITQQNKLDYINSISAPIANFTAIDTQNCSVPNNVIFSNASTNNFGSTYFWNFGDGTTSVLANPTNLYTVFGNYTVTLVVNKNGCNDTIVKPNFIKLTPQNADFTANFTTRCAGQAIQFTDLSALTPTTRSWNFGDGSPNSTLANPTKTYNNPGVYTVTLTTTKPGCNDIETKVNYITINAIPTVTFVADQTDSCGYPFPVQFTSTTSAVTNYNWTFGDGTSSNLANPLHTYNTPGSFNVSLVVTNAAGCSRTFNQPNLINIVPPVANFNIDSAFGCNPKTISITDLSTSPNGITQWIWDFGDGMQQNGPNNPTHVYTDTGTYNISLIVIDNNGCRDTINPLKKVDVGQAFTVDFTATPVVACKIEGITFTNLTDTLLIDDVTWRWDFGDGGIAQSYDAFYEYGDTGLFEVTLTAFHNGCASSISYPDLIRIHPPIALFSAEVDCDNFLRLSFLDGSIGPDNWLWDINGDTLTGQNVDYIFPNIGIYDATLYVENTTFGCIDSLTQSFTIQQPTLGFYSDDSLGCAPFAVQFTDSSNLAVAWNWNFGDGGSSSVQNPNYTYNNTGVYDVTLIIENSFGCLDTIFYAQMINVIGSSPQFEAIDTSGCRNFLATFSDLSTSVAGPIINWNWNFGDGNTSTLQNPTNNYTSVGSFDVSLTTTDSAGCVNTLNKINYITSTGPLPSFSNPSLVCVNSNVTFNNTSTSLGGTITSWNWNFGDGNTSSLQNPTHSYANSGIYTVSLYLLDNNGCDTTFIKPNAISVDTLNVDFAADSTVGNCTGFIVNFNQLASPNPTSWNWNFGNGNTSTVPTPSTVFSTVGSFDVKLVVTNTAGCIDSIIKPNFITVSGPTGILSVSEDTGCIDFAVDFSIISPNSINQIWDFGDGNVVNNNLLNFSHTYTNSSTFFPLVILEDITGCLIPYYFDTIFTASLAAQMNIDTDYICTPNIINFADSSQSSQPVNNWLWNFGDGNTSTLQNPNHNYTTDGIFDVSLIVNNGICADTVSQLQTIVSDSSTKALFSFTPPAIICPPVNIGLTNLSSADSTIVAWNWNFGNGTNSNLQNPTSITFDTAGTYFVSLEILTEKGCESTLTDSIVINPIPTFAFDLDSMLLCLGTDSILPSLQDNATITWTPNTNLSCADCPNPTIFGVSSNTYFVNAINEFGCTYNDTLFLTVGNLPPLTVSEDQKVLIGTEVNMNAFSPGISDFNWSPSENLSCNNCTTNTFIANETTSFIISIEDEFGCKSIDTILVEVFNMCDDNFLLFPNVFTPNDDNKNDVFKPISLRNLKTEINYFRIFDRWGKLIFETDDFSNAWDGKFNGNYMNNGVYVYVVDIVCSDSSNKLVHGNVTLIR